MEPPIAPIPAAVRLLGVNAEFYREVVPRIVKAAPDAVLVVVTDPPDPMADGARELAGHERVGC